MSTSKKEVYKDQIFLLNESIETHLNRIKLLEDRLADCESKLSDALDLNAIYAKQLEESETFYANQGDM